ncbi:hypothetical protein FQA47_015950 [Oryzias melastigma]|uniref:Uncharacterized protein n=1 Tax=Oryzias melastigma TaxID=30732 RepID=A0A834C0H4_ORYME|nr:hypothetical protein FQA47_015950 [Oryzias melastigma]
MQYCAQNQNSNWTSSQVSQSGSQFVQDASQTQQSLNTNGIHQYNVQQHQSLNVSYSQLYELRRQKTNQNIAGAASSDRSANIKNSSLLVSLLRDGILPDINQALGRQTQASITNKNTTPFQQVVSVERQQCRCFVILPAQWSSAGILSEFKRRNGESDCLHPQQQPP